MPGSPVRTLRRVEKLEQQSIELAHSVFQVAPQQFVNPPGSKPVPQPFRRDPLKLLWQDAVSKSMAASVALEALGDHLRERAGSSEPSAFARLGAEMVAESGGEKGEQHNGELGT